MLGPLGPVDRHRVAGHRGDEPFARQIVDRPDQISRTVSRALNDRTLRTLFTYM